MRLALAAVLALSLAGCGTCPPGTPENAANVAAIVAQNDELLDKSGLAPSVTAAHKLRNREAVELAKRLAEECAR
jgi:hypothetical protein